MDPRVEFSGRPLAGGGAARWRGEVEPRQTGPHRFTLEGVLTSHAVWVDGEQVDGRGATWAPTRDVDLVAGQRYAVEVTAEVDPGLPPSLALKWRTPLGTAPEGVTLVPQSQLYPAALAAPAASQAEDLPEAFALGASYPNPSAGRTLIPYALPEAADVRVEVYDALGRRVAVVVDGQREAGRHEAALEAGRLASGVYLYRMTATAPGQRFSEARRMLVVR